MSLTKTQIDAEIDRNCKTNAVSYPVDKKTADINLALDYILGLIFKKCSNWQFDDSNYDDYPIITTNLIAGQRDYSFVYDENGNLILDIYRVMIKDQSGRFVDLKVENQTDRLSPITFQDGLEGQGTPKSYSKTGNGIFLDAVPSYNSTGGLKLMINREGSYFNSSDTTKRAGIVGLYHEYLALRPSYYYAMRNGLKNTQNLYNEMMKMEGLILDYYGQRTKDQPSRATPRVDSTR